jgi:hypothetical protein
MYTVTYQDLCTTHTVKIEANSPHQAITFAQCEWQKANPEYALEDLTDNWHSQKT